MLPLSEVRPARLVVEASPLVSPLHPRQAVEIFVNGVHAAKVILTASSGSRIEIAVPDEAEEEIRANGDMRLRFMLPNAARPIDLGINADSRHLALHLASITAM